MIWNSEVEAIMNFVLMQAKSFINDERKSNLSNRKDLYLDDSLYIIEDALKDNFCYDTYKKLKLMVDESCNILKRIINEISIVYKESPKRYWDNEGVQGAYDEIIERTNVNQTMQSVNAYTNLLNHCGVLVLPNRRNQIQYSILTPELVDVYQNPDQPDDIQALAYQVLTPSTLGVTDFKYVYWDVFGNHKVFNKDGVQLLDENNPQGINPYKDPNDPERTIIPVTWFHRRKPEFSWWDTTSGNDLYSGAVQIGVLLTYLNYMMRVTGFPLKYIVGKVEAPMEQLLDPANLMQLFSNGVEQPQIGSLANNFNLKEFWDVINEKIGLIANNYGLSMSNFKWTAQRTSGYALLLENWGKVEQVQKQVPMYREGERDLWEKTKIVNNALKGSKQIADAEFSIDYAEVEFKEDPNLENQKWQTWIDNGVASPVDWIQALNPDLTEEEAREQYEKNLEDRNQIKQRYGGLLNLGQSNQQPSRQGGSSAGSSQK